MHSESIFFGKHQTGSRNVNSVSEKQGRVSRDQIVATMAWCFSRINLPLALSIFRFFFHYLSHFSLIFVFALFSCLPSQTLNTCLHATFDLPNQFYFLTLSNEKRQKPVPPLAQQRPASPSCVCPW